jgi:hypothetical protein
MADEVEGTENPPVIGVTFSATTDGDLSCEVFEDAGDRFMSTGELLVLACYIRATTDTDWGLELVDWLETAHGDRLGIDADEDVVEGAAV